MPRAQDALPDFLADRVHIQRAQATATVFLRHAQVPHPDRLDLADQLLFHILREVVVVILLLEGDDLFIHEAFDGVADHPNGFRILKVHCRHAPLLRSRWPGGWTGSPGPMR